jgi:hypothetical protein
MDLSSFKVKISQNRLKLIIRKEKYHVRVRQKEEKGKKTMTVINVKEQESTR